MTAPNIFGVHPPTADPDDLPTPDNGPYFVFGRTGWMSHMNFHFGRALVPVGENNHIQSMNPFLWSDIQIPIELVGQAWSFFRAIWETRKSEAMVDITWSEAKGYRLFIPPQQATSGGVKCERNLDHYKGQMVGTIHSHCNFSAFHSGTDTHDADSHNGLHITLGNVDKNQPSIAIMISLNKTRWDFKPDELWEEAAIPLVGHPKWWEKFVSDPVKTVSSGTTVTKWSKPAAQAHHSKYLPTVIQGVTPPRTAATARSYDSIDELLWKNTESIDGNVAMQLDAANEMIEEITKAVSQLGYDIDYEISEQISTSKEKDDITRARLDDHFARMWMEDSY